MPFAKVVGIYQGHTNSVRAICWSPDGRLIASAGEKGIIHIWNVLHATSAFQYEADAAAVTDLAWSPDGTKIASAGSDGCVHIWKVGE